MDRNPYGRAPQLVLCGILGLTALSACTSPAAPPRRPPIDVTLRDFRISETTADVGDGDVDLRVHNAAPATHEFVVVRTDLAPDRLPIGTDGLSVDEDRLQAVDEIPELNSGATDTLSVHLAPGHYVFFCNLEGHYLGGMRGAFEVTGDG